MIAVGSDHAGYDLKQEIVKLLEKRGLEYKDYGTFTRDSCSYVEFGYRTARAVASGECERGILICGTGIGMSITANKVRGIRCAACSEPYSAAYSRMHNDSNILAIGARVVGPGLAEEIVEAWLDTQFEGGRHAVRLGQITELESNGKLSGI